MVGYGFKQSNSSSHSGGRRHCADVLCLVTGGTTENFPGVGVKDNTL